MIADRPFSVLPLHHEAPTAPRRDSNPDYLFSTEITDLRPAHTDYCEALGDDAGVCVLTGVKRSTD